ncbi:unnamed protein product [Penicillium salamii]|nr:unnamed protein product [Penicillium salamii]CAG7964815.1 unnamed protein product [Penicillium salamii]CAG8278191.1 unnamed protein product [Penicillium salamii]
MDFQFTPNTSNMDIQQILASPLVTFVVGPEEHEVRPHAYAISRQSPVLRVLLEGPFKEAKDKMVKWPEVDVETFYRFMDFAYRQDYRVPEPLKVPFPPIPPLAQKIPEFGPQHLVIFNSWGGPQHFEIPYINDWATSDDYPGALWTWCGDGNRRDEDWSPALAAHAKLYVLGDTYQIIPLCRLACFRAYSILRRYCIHAPECPEMEGLIWFARYIYNNTPPRSVTKDPMRELISRYLANNQEEVPDCEEFQQLLEDVPELADDFIMEFTKEHHLE